MAIKFSIIMPVYNVAEYVGLAIESVLKQTYAYWELLAVDDGSSDDSGKILDEYARKESRIRVFHQKNGGVSSARNKALSQVRGDWIVFLDADDIIHPRALAQMERELADHVAADLLKFDFVNFKDGEDVRWLEADKKSKIVSIEKSLPMGLIMVPFWNFAMSRRVVGDLKFEPYCRGEDRLFLGEVLTKSQSIAIVTETFYGYRVRAGSAMNSQMTSRKLIDRIGYSLRWLEVMTKSGRLIPREFYHLVFVNLTEGFVMDIYKIPLSERSALWRQWYRCLGELKNYWPYLSLWARLVLEFCDSFRFSGMAWLFCYLPGYFKCHGITKFLAGKI